MRSYQFDDPSLNRLITELIDAAGDGTNADLAQEIITSAIKLFRDQADRGDMKLINAAVKELRYSLLIFSRYQEIPKVTMFGSARTQPDDPNYQLAIRFAEKMVQERGWMVGKFGQVWRTDDGGVTWESVPALGDLEGLSGDEKPNLRSVCFVDADHGWAAGSWSEMPQLEQFDWAVIIHTRDGGRT